jgi:hypothetical protein
MTAPRRESSGEGQPPPDVELAAEVRAKSLRFARVPNTAVEFEGDADPRSRSASERENIPEKVEPQTTYREVTIRWRAAGLLGEPQVPDDR